MTSLLEACLNEFILPTTTAHNLPGWPNVSDLAAIIASAAASKIMTLRITQLVARRADNFGLDLKPAMTPLEIVQTAVKENPKISVSQLAQRSGLSWWQCRRLLKTHQVALEVQRGRPRKPRLPIAEDRPVKLGANQTQTDAPRATSPALAAYPGQQPKSPGDHTAPTSRQNFPNADFPITLGAPPSAAKSEQTGSMRILSLPAAPMELLLIMLESMGERFAHPKIFNITQRIQIGRDPQSDIILTSDSAVSRTHAVVLPVRGSFLIRDLGSTNRTFVNGKAVNVHTLQDGDEIRIGDTFLLVQLMQITGPSHPVPSRAPMSDGAALIEWRRQEKLTQTDLASKLQVSQRAVSMWENGQPISLENRKKLEGLGCKLSTIAKD